MLKLLASDRLLSASKKPPPVTARAFCLAKKKG
jgi:hypothetical protein